MVSLWPFATSSTSSAASFEKQLSTLSTKISRYASQSELLRTRQRRYKALCTIYGSFAYILVLAILVLVTGWQKWRAAEYTAVLGSPVLIYGLRSLLDLWYNYRVSNAQRRLEEVQAEREEAISKLKKATKYDSTQQLLDKYGGTPKRGKSPQPPGVKRKPSARQSLPAQLQQGSRTGFAPPPTANIQIRQPPLPLQNAMEIRPMAAQSATLRPQNDTSEPSESFAPNAFAHPSPSFPPAQSGAHGSSSSWYDRILDVVLGEDETQAKNRFALICSQCRLVNGQAPPGAKTLEDVGKWRCRECHAMNGVESEAVKALGRAEESGVQVRSPTEDSHEMAEQIKEEESEAGTPDDHEGTGVPHAASPADSTRSKARQRSRKTDT